MAEKREIVTLSREKKKWWMKVKCSREYWKNRIVLGFEMWFVSSWKFILFKMVLEILGEPRQA